MTASMRRALSRSTPGALEYRADYDGQGWRWHRISWSCLLDHAGSVSRLLGKVENVDRSKAAALRYRRLTARQKKLAPGVLATMRLDLTADRILDVKAASRHLTQALFGNTADACLRHLRDNVPEEAALSRFDVLFRREPLLEAFRQGVDRQELAHPLRSSESTVSWARTTVELTEEPDSGHTAAFCTVTDETDRHRRDAILEVLARRDYEILLTVDAASGLCRAYGRFQDTIPPGTSFRPLLARYLQTEVPSSRQRTALRAALRMETVTEQLAHAPVYEFSAPLLEGPPLLLRWSWLDQPGGVLLLTGQRTPLAPAEGFL